MIGCFSVYLDVIILQTSRVSMCNLNRNVLRSVIIKCEDKKGPMIYNSLLFPIPLFLFIIIPIMHTANCTIESYVDIRSLQFLVYQNVILALLTVHCTCLKLSLHETNVYILLIIYVLFILKNNIFQIQSKVERGLTDHQEGNHARVV